MLCLATAGAWLGALSVSPARAHPAVPAAGTANSRLYLHKGWVLRAEDISDIAGDN